MKSKDIDLWHIIVDGDYKPTFRNTSTGRDETLPYERLSDDNKKMLSKNNEAKMVLHNALPKKEALPTKWHPKVKAIEESKDLSTLHLDELISNLKLCEVVLEKDFEASKNKKAKYKSLALKAKKMSSDEETSFSDSEDEEYAMAVFRKAKDDKSDQKAFFRGTWIDSDEEEDLKKDEICLMAHDLNEVHSDTIYYSNSSLDDETLQNEYKKLCEISLRIIKKDKHLKTKIELLDNEVFELKERLKRLEKNKAISEECQSCIDLRTKNESFTSKLAKFKNSTHFLQEMLENQRLHNDKKGMGFTEHKASTSGVKT
ncbi:hypothetical protein Tco_0496600 [Tanacetum coccineum]